jgi:CDP-diacylglycerol--serine O-phosphatidyltransferase
VAMVAGSLMVSRFRYLSGKDLDPKMRIPVAFMVLVPLGFVLVGSSPPEMLFALFALYASSGPLLWLVRRMRRGRRGPPRAPTPGH